MKSISSPSLVLGGGLGTGQGGPHWKKHHHNGYLTCNDNLLTGSRGEQVPCQHQIPWHCRKKPLLCFPPTVPLLWSARDNTVGGHLPELIKSSTENISTVNKQGGGVPPLKDSCGKTANFHTWERLYHYRCHIKYHSLASVTSQVSSKFDYTRLTCVIGFQGESSLKEAIFANRLGVGLHGMNSTWKSKVMSHIHKTLHDRREDMTSLVRSDSIPTARIMNTSYKGGSMDRVTTDAQGFD